MSTPLSPAEATVVVIDDHAIVRSGLEFLLSREPWLTFVGSAHDRVSALELVEQKHPTIILSDLVFPRDSGFRLIQDLRSRFAQARVIAFSFMNEDACAERCLRLGVKGFISKELSEARIVENIRKVVAGGTCFSQTLTENMLTRIGMHPGEHVPTRTELLSPMEFQVFEMIGQGMATNEIAQTLVRSAKTIETYRARIKIKLGLSNGIQLAQYAVQHMNGYVNNL